MQGFGTDRTLSGQEWRSLILAGCGVLVVGLGLGVLVGRLTAAPPEPPPASASILPDTGALPGSTPAIDVAGDVTNSAVPAAPPPSPPALAATPAAPSVAAPTVVPPVQRVADLSPPVPTPRSRQAAHPIETKQAEAKPKAASKPAEAKPKAASKPAAKPVPRPEPTPASEAAPTGGPHWAVQLGAFQSADHANLLVYTLARHGQRARVHLVNGLFYVQTPPYQSAAAAKTAAQALAAREHLATYLIKLPDQAG
jgi:cell division septation protein DedD